jgi:hypothetical protein
LAADFLYRFYAAPATLNAGQQGRKGGAMKIGKVLRFAWRIGVCIAVIVAFAAYFARELVPGMPLLTVFAWVIAGMVIIGAAIVATVFVQGSFNQWTFNKGGLDPQWLWFREDPPGTAQLRELRRDKTQ